MTFTVKKMHPEPEDGEDMGKDVSIASDSSRSKFLILILLRV